MSCKSVTCWSVNDVRSIFNTTESLLHKNNDHRGLNAVCGHMSQTSHTHTSHALHGLILHLRGYVESSKPTTGIQSAILCPCRCLCLFLDHPPPSLPPRAAATTSSPSPAAALHLCCLALVLPLRFRTPFITLLHGQSCR